MKLAIYVICFAPLIGWAKVSDFNSLIQENSVAQRELQTHIQKNADPKLTQVFIAAPKAPSVTKYENKVVFKTATYNAPTNSMVLKFKKEISQKRASKKKELDRLASEINALDREL